mgnify:CR=1 FL=1
MVDENLLITRAQQGDRAAFRQIYELYLRRVISHVGRIMGPGPEVEDVVQNVFIQVHRSLPSFKGDSKFSTWLYRVTWNVTVSYLRKRVPTVDLPALKQFAATEEQWDRIEARDKLRTLHAGIADLSSEYREAFVLFELEGLSLQEIADMKDESINTIASRVRRARERLRVLLERAEQHNDQRQAGTR